MGPQGDQGVDACLSLWAARLNSSPWLYFKCWHNLGWQFSWQRESHTTFPPPSLPTAPSLTLWQGLTVPQKSYSPLTMGYLKPLWDFWLFHILVGISVCISSTMNASSTPQLSVCGAFRDTRFSQRSWADSLMGTCCQDSRGFRITHCSPRTKQEYLFAAAEHKK